MLVNIFMNCRRKDEIIFALAGLCAVFAGVLNGLIGTGGGVILLFILRKLCGDRKAFASVLITVIPVSLVSAYIYCRSDPALFGSALPYLIPAAAGGTLGAAFFGKIKTKTLKILFSLMLTVSGALAVFG